jgi:hypothetical protein
MALALLAHAHMPLKFWDEAFTTVTYLTNRLPTRVIDNLNPLERLFKTPPDYSMLKIFGCTCWPHLRPYNKHKLSFRSKPCVFIGYSLLHKGYTCLDMDTGHVYITWDAIFDEAIFHFSNPSSTVAQQSQGDDRFNWNANLLHNLLPVNSMAAANNGAGNPPGDMQESSPVSAPLPARTTLLGLRHHYFMIWLLIQRTHQVHWFLCRIHMVSQPQTVSCHQPRISSCLPMIGPRHQGCPIILRPLQPQKLDQPHMRPTTVDNTGIIGSSSCDGAARQPSVPEPVHPYRTRLQNDIKKQKICMDGTVTYSAVRSSQAEPLSHVVAMEHLLWRRAMHEEFEALIKNKMWHLVPPRAGINVIDSKRVFKLKHKPDGSIDCYKARLVAKGFKQQ